MDISLYGMPLASAARRVAIGSTLYSSTSECPLDLLSVMVCEVSSLHHVCPTARCGGAVLPFCPVCPGGSCNLLCALLHPYVPGRGLSILSAWKAKGIEINNMAVKIKE